MPVAVFALLAALQLATPPDTARLAIVATTDVHGRVRGWDYVRDAEAPGGLSRAATVIETLRAQYADRVILVDAGDLLQGNPFATYFAGADRRPHPIVDALNALGYDAATPGNHDLDFGLPVLSRAAGDATYRYVSANVRVSAPGARAGADTLLFAPHAIVTRGGVRVGITGFTTPGVMVWNRAGLAAGRVRVRPLAASAPAALRDLGRAGVDLTIALVHSGLAGGSSYDTTGVGPENDAALLAQLDPRPHIVIVGHSHRELRDSVINGVHFVQPRHWARSLAVVHVTLVSQGSGDGGRGTGKYRVVEIRPEIVPLGSVAEAPRIVRRMEQAHELARTWASRPIGTAGAGWEARFARVEDTPLLDFVNAVQRRQSGAQLSATAAFDVAGGFREGGIRLGDVAGLYPYENTLRAVRLSGAQLKDFLEHSARYFRTWQPGQSPINEGVPGYNFDVVDGAEYTLDLNRPPGERVRGLRVDGRPVAPGDSFTLALNSYRQEGGGGYAMLRGAPVVYDRGESVRDLLVAEIERLGALDARAFYRPSWSLAPTEAREAARLGFAPAPRPVGADSTLLRVLAISDFHGSLEARIWPWSDGRPVGGAAALKPWLDSLDRECGCSVVRLDGGDQWQGTPLSNFTRGRAAVEVLNQLGLDAAAIGNHEFDWTIDTMVARMAEARYQFVAANITDTVRGGVPPWAPSWTIVSRGAVKVAVIGLSLQTTPASTNPLHVRGLAFGEGAAAIRRVLPEARAAADFVVVVAHEGASCDSGGCRGEILDVARGLDSGAVDLIVAGHTHRPVDTRVNGIPIIQGDAYGRRIAVADFVRTRGGREVRTRLVTPFADQVRPDTGLARLVYGLTRRFDSITTRPVATLARPLRRQGSEHALGRLIADAQRNMGRGDVAVMNNGGIRADLPAGLVTYGDLYTVQPFENRLLRITLSGEDLLRVLEHVVAGERPGGHVAGVRIWYEPRLPSGRRITRTLLQTGRPIDRRRSYTLVISDFLAVGGDGFTMLAGLPAEDLDLIDSDALVRYLRVLKQPVEAPPSERIHQGR